jgi:hypothetical protein
LFGHTLRTQHPESFLVSPSRGTETLPNDSGCRGLFVSTVI